MSWDIIWIFLGIGSLAILAVYWGNRNSIWGGFTAGFVIGMGIASFTGFNWFTIGKAAIIGTLIGFSAELLGIISAKMKDR